MKTADHIRDKLYKAGLKITPQRMAILEAIYGLNNHPTADLIIDQIRKTYPNIATGTVYKVLDTLVEKEIIRRVKTDRDVMRYDGIMDHHHHLYCNECDVIEDYVDDDLDKMLKDYFKKKSFPGFQIEDIVLQIKGTFDKC